MAVGIKIWEENKSDNGGPYHASPFLWGAMIGGWILPMMGVPAYVAVNYYWFEFFSLEMFIEMLGLFQEYEFADAAFHGELAGEESKKLLEKVHYDEVKEEAEERDRSTSFIAKFAYPFKIPVLLAYTMAYNAIFIGFIASLILSYDSNNQVSFIDFTISTGIATLVVMSLVIVGNIHIIIIINVILITIIIGALIITPLMVTYAAVMLIKKCFTRRNDRDQYAAII
jgi:hypothetical protein